MEKKLQKSYLTEWIHKKCTDSNKFYLEYKNFRDGLIEFKCLCCNKKYDKTCNINVKKKSFNTCKFSNQDINKFVLLLWKGIFLYEYIDDWRKFNEIPLPEKEYLYSHLHMKDITDADYKHTKEFVKIFKQKVLVNTMIYLFKEIRYCWLMCLIILEICVLKYIK